MRARWLCLLAMSAFMVLPGARAAAQVAELQVGTRVRVRAPSAVAGRLTGVVLVRTNDSVTVSREDAMPIAIPLSALTSLEVSRGRSRGLGAAKGAMWGGGVMLLLGAGFSDRPCKPNAVADTCERVSAAENALYAGVSGAMIGAIIGAAVGSERWVRAELPGRVSIFTTPTPMGTPVIGVRFAMGRR